MSEELAAVISTPIGLVYRIWFAVSPVFVVVLKADPMVSEDDVRVRVAGKVVKIDVVAIPPPPVGHAERQISEVRQKMFAEMAVEEP